MKTITEKFETKIIEVDGEEIGFLKGEKVKKPYLPEKYKMVQFQVIELKGEKVGDKVIIEITATPKEINEIKKDKKLKWLKQ